MAKRRKRKYGFSFSWRRLLGVQTVKQKIARATGIPTTRQGRQRKLGRLVGLVLPFVCIGLLLLACALCGVVISGN